MHANSWGGGGGGGGEKVGGGGGGSRCVQADGDMADRITQITITILCLRVNCAWLVDINCNQTQ